MRENFDYVTMLTYSADMAEHTQRAVEIIESLKRRTETAEKLVARLVLAAGGEIEIYDLDLQSLNPIELTIHRNESDMSFIWKAERKR
jgi:hypothetical protein